MIEKLQQAFARKGYGRIQTNAAEVTGFYKEAEEQGYCVCIIDDRNNFLNGAGKKDYLISQICSFLQEKRGVPCCGLGIIVTDQPERTKESAVGAEKYWLADEASGRLIVYEDQPGEFLDARGCIETVLYDGGWASQTEDSAENIPYGNSYYRSHDFPGRNTERVGAFHLTPVNTCLVILNVLLFLILEYMGDTESAEFIYRYGGMTIESVMEEHQYWRLLACAFLHFGISHLFSNMLVLAFVGDNLERALGSVKYLALYLLGGIGSSFLSCLWMFLNKEYNVVSAGASGAVFAVLGGIFYVLLKNHGRKDDLSTGKVGMFLAFSIFQGLTSVTTNNSAHISGLLLGLILAAVLYQNDKKSCEPV